MVEADKTTRHKMIISVPTLENDIENERERERNIN